MHKVTFYPLCRESGKPPNAEAFRIDLNNSRQVLIDYANMKDATDKSDLRCDLPKLLKDDLKARDYYDVVIFTHLDDDHVRGAGEFFWFERYPDRQEKGRIKMRELWVPAAAIVEPGLDGDAELIRAEARHRLRNKAGIRVFSAPDTLGAWCKNERLDIEELRELGLIIDAGKIVPGFSLANDGVEFFVHSPFASRTDDGKLIERNKDAIVLQAKFILDGGITRFLIMADVTHSEIDEIVRMTRLRERDERLSWDILDIPHHCSYTGIGPEKGRDVTEATDSVKWLHAQGQTGGIIVSSSCIIPSVDTTQPPHRQAAAYYRKVKATINGEFVVTMEEPKKTAPEPLVIEITGRGAAVKRAAIVTVGGGAVAGTAHRVGLN